MELDVDVARNSPCSHLCLCLPLQIYEDSIVIKSVFESARQRIVTDEEQKETVSASHSDNGGRAEDQFVPSAGESWNSNIRRDADSYRWWKVCRLWWRSTIWLINYWNMWKRVFYEFYPVFSLLQSVKPLAMQLKKGTKEERSRNTIAKRLHSDVDSDEDLEDNTTKDEGWTESPCFFCILIHVYSPPHPLSFGFFIL